VLPQNIGANFVRETVKKKRLIDQVEYGSGAIRFGPPRATL